MNLLEIKNLKTYFYTDKGISKAVDGVNFTVNKGEVLGLVGESGCGKTLTALSILRLVPPPGRIVEGEIIYKSRKEEKLDLTKIPEKEIIKIRGKEISMIFQEPQTSLNPVFTVGNQIVESLLVHTAISKKQAKEIAIEILLKVGIKEPQIRFNQYPHQLSGGQQQRIMIAMALITKPSLLIADEPTTALDVTVQAQILELLTQLKKEFNLSILFITHDLSLMLNFADRICVMYAGKFVESALVKDLFENPKHPYTKGLISALPKIKTKQKRLPTIAGRVPEPYNLPTGCIFHPRCEYKIDECTKISPELKLIENSHWSACIRQPGLF
ncbi:MAG: ABC transporter ATP-binding protein [Endomicrobiia bacterium]